MCHYAVYHRRTDIVSIVIRNIIDVLISISSHSGDELRFDDEYGHSPVGEANLGVCPTSSALTSLQTTRSGTDLVVQWDPCPSRGVRKTKSSEGRLGNPAREGGQSRSPATVACRAPGGTRSSSDVESDFRLCSSRLQLRTSYCNSFTPARSTSLTQLTALIPPLQSCALR